MFAIIRNDYICYINRQLCICWISFCTCARAIYMWKLRHFLCNLISPCCIAIFALVVSKWKLMPFTLPRICGIKIRETTFMQGFSLSRRKKTVSLRKSRSEIPDYEGIVYRTFWRVALIMRNVHLTYGGNAECELYVISRFRFVVCVRN